MLRNYQIADCILSSVTPQAVFSRLPVDLLELPVVALGTLSTVSALEDTLLELRAYESVSLQTRPAPRLLVMD